MSREAEIELYRAWSEYLTELFESSLPRPTRRSLERNSTGDAAARGRYLDRVGQDLESFHQRLSDIMEKDQRG